MAAVCGSGPEQRFELWADRQADPALFADLPQIAFHPHFQRRLRRPQAWWLYRRLLEQPGKVFLPTAGATDLTLLCAAARGPLRPGKAYGFVHWIRPTPSRLRRLAAAARRQPDLGVLGPTDEIVEFLQSAGFRRAARVPYPISPSARPTAEGEPFRHVLFAGAARMDKGFDRVVDLIEHLAARGETLPVHLQTSTRHYGKRDAQVARQLDRLAALGYAGLREHADTLDPQDYFALFRGAICLQPYAKDEFAHRVSAVTVDALGCGAPVVTTAGTWMGRSVERLGAGLAVADPTGPALAAAVQQIVDDYPRYSIAARLAARTIHAEHAPRHLLEAVLDRGP